MTDIEQKRIDELLRAVEAMADWHKECEGEFPFSAAMNAITEVVHAWKNVKMAQLGSHADFDDTRV